MTEHPVKRKLRNEILPYLASARRLRRQWFYISHIIFGYTTDILVALTTIGVVSPALSGLLANEPGVEASSATTLADLLATVPEKLYIPVAVVVIAWIVLRIAFNREDGQKKAVLAKSCRLTMRLAEARLPSLLGESDPMSGIIKLYKEDLFPTMDRAVQEGAWPWLPFAPGINDEVERQLAELCQKYESEWQSIDQSVRAGASAGGHNG